MASIFSAYKSSPARPTDLHLRSTVGLAETRYFFWMALPTIMQVNPLPRRVLYGSHGNPEVGKCASYFKRLSLHLHLQTRYQTTP